MWWEEVAEKPGCEAVNERLYCFVIDFYVLCATVD